MESIPRTHYLVSHSSSKACTSKYSNRITLYALLHSELVGSAVFQAPCECHLSSDHIVPGCFIIILRRGYSIIQHFETVEGLTSLVSLTSITSSPSYQNQFVYHVEQVDAGYLKQYDRIRTSSSSFLKSWQNPIMR